jgi:hypothetical protein
MIGRTNLSWKGDRLYVGTRLSGYSVVPDEQYPSMWRIRRPDGSSSDMVNRSRAKDAAMTMLARDLNNGKSGEEGPRTA